MWVPRRCALAESRAGRPGSVRAAAGRPGRSARSPIVGEELGEAGDRNDRSASAGFQAQPGRQPPPDPAFGQLPQPRLGNPGEPQGAVAVEAEASHPPDIARVFGFPAARLGQVGDLPVGVAEEGPRQRVVDAPAPERARCRRRCRAATSPTPWPGTGLPEYVLQRRHDERRAKLAPHVAMRCGQRAYRTYPAPTTSGSPSTRRSDGPPTAAPPPVDPAPATATSATRRTRQHPQAAPAANPGHGRRGRRTSPSDRAHTP